MRHARLAAALLVLGACDAEPDEPAADPVRLAAGAPLTVELAAGETVQAGVALASGEALVTWVEQRGVDVAVAIYDPAGAERLAVDHVGGRAGAEPLALRADQGGTWVIALSPVTGEAGGEVVVRRPNPAPDDDRRVAAFEDLIAARDAQRRGDGASLREARDRYDLARAGFAAIEDHWGEAQATDQLGRVLKTLGDRRGAIPLRERALALREAAGDGFGVETSALGLANLHAWFGDDEAAVALYQRALSAAEAIGDERGIAIITTNLGMEWDDRGDYPRALAAYYDALAVQEALGDEHGAAFSHQGLGNAYRRLGDAPRATEHIEAALRLRAGLGETRWAAGDHYALGLVRLELEADPLGAMDALETGLALRAGLGYFSDREPQVQIALARAYGALGLVDEANATLDEARAGLASLGLGTADVALALGDVALVDGDGAAASAHYREAARQDPEGLRTRLRAGAGLGRALLLLGDRHGARAALERTLAEVEAIRASLPAELLRGTWLGAWRALHDLLVTLDLTGPEPDVERAFHDHERGLARALLDTVTPAAPPSELTAVAAALEDDEALVSLVLGDEGGWALVVTRDGARAVPLAPRAAVLDRADALVTAVTARSRAPEGEPIAARRRRVAAADARVPALAAALGELVWAPFADGLPERVVLVADPALEAVPVALLPGPDGAPAIDDHILVRAPSASVWLALTRRRQARSDGVLVIADPAFGAADPRVSITHDRPRAQAFARLRFSAVEAAAIRAAVPGARVVSGLAASRDAVIDALAGHGVLHFATHVVIDPVEPARSGVVLSMVDAAGVPVDGLLTAGDVAGLTLAAELVVLSGCASGLGRATRGEGVMGLSRAFLEAGARRTLVSRWRVHDRGTAELMGRFFRARGDGLTDGAALRRAALALRADPRWAAPYYWAAFTLVGADR